jgi:hypothetical protein
MTLTSVIVFSFQSDGECAYAISFLFMNQIYHCPKQSCDLQSRISRHWEFSDEFFDEVLFGNITKHLQLINFPHFSSQTLLRPIEFADATMEPKLTSQLDEDLHQGTRPAEATDGLNDLSFSFCWVLPVIHDSKKKEELRCLLIDTLDQVLAIASSVTDETMEDSQDIVSRSD